MNESPILVQHVSRSYDGQSVIKDLNFSVAPGSIYGFLGRNGSGKTTTIRMLVGLIKPHAGKVRIMGNDPFAIGAEERQWLGYMSEKAIVPTTSRISNVLKLGRDLYPDWENAMNKTKQLLTLFKFVFFRAPLWDSFIGADLSDRAL